MKRIRITIIILFCSILALSLMAQKESFDAIYKKITKEYSLEKDGKMTYHYYKELRLNTYMSFHRLFGETFIVYNPEYQKLTINKCYTIMADGKRVEAPSNAFNEVLPFFAAKAPEYNHLREMVVTHTGLERGATIYLDYTLISDPGFMPFLMGDELLREDMPVEQMEVIVRVPSGTTLQHKAVQYRIAPEVTDDGSISTYKWSLSNITPDSHERMNMPEMFPRLIFSTAGDMQKAYFHFVDQEAFRHKTGNVIDKKVDAVKASAKDDFEIILNLQEMAVNQVNHVEVPMRHTGFRVRPSEVIWQSTYGSALERAVLLADMLLKAGINAYPVVAIPEGVYDPAIGSLLQYDKFYVQVNPKDYGQIYLSTDRVNIQNEKFNLAGYVLIPLDAAIETMRTFREKDLTDEMILHGDIEIIDTATMTGSLQLKMSNGKNPYFKLMSDTSYIKRSFSIGIASSDLKNVELVKLNEGFSETNFDLERKKPLSKYADYLIFELPVLNDGFTSWHLSTLTWERQDMLQLPGFLKEEYEFIVKIPVGWSLINEPVKQSISNEAGKLDINLEYKSGQVVIERKIEIRKAKLTAKELSQLRSLVEGWQNKNIEKLIFQVK